MRKFSILIVMILIFSSTGCCKDILRSRSVSYTIENIDVYFLGKFKLKSKKIDILIGDDFNLIYLKTREKKITIFLKKENKDILISLTRNKQITQKFIFIEKRRDGFFQLTRIGSHSIGDHPFAIG